jgi:cellulose synthase/poly-beta-1,6-N-acetylglucosamine synthase-like glycosyltransferase
VQSLRWPLLFSGVLGVLIFTLYASFAFQGVAAWSIGLVYISYDSVLLAFMVVSSQMAVNQQDRARNLPPEPSASPAFPCPTLSVLICARNERVVLPECLRALRVQTEPAEEIIILDDGSTDSMVEWLTTTYALTFEPMGRGSLGRSATWPGLFVLSKPNSGKADSLNLGWKLTRSEIVVTLDADTVVEPEALAAIRAGFGEDPHLGIAGGVLTPICQRTPLAGFFQFFQTFEYARGFLWRLTWMQYDMLLLISGAFAASRRGFTGIPTIPTNPSPSKPWSWRKESPMRPPPCPLSSINAAAGSRASSLPISSITTWSATRGTAPWVAICSA